MIAGNGLRRWVRRNPPRQDVPGVRNPRSLRYLYLVCRRRRVLLAVRPQMFRDALKECLVREPDLRIVGEVHDPRDLVRALRQKRPHVLLQSWPDGHVSGTIANVHREFPKLVIVGLAGNGVCGARQRVVTTELFPRMTLRSLLAAIRGEAG